MSMSWLIPRTEPERTVEDSIDTVASWWSTPRTILRRDAVPADQFRHDTLRVAMAADNQGVSPKIATPALGQRAARMTTSLCHSRLHPPAEERHLILRPSPVARHPPGLDLLQDRVGVVANVVDLPEVEHDEHRFLVALGEERFDVFLEIDWVRRCHRYLPPPRISGPVRSRPSKFYPAAPSGTVSPDALDRGQPRSNAHHGG